MDNNLVRRILFAVVAIPLALLLVWAGGWPLAVLVSTIAVLGNVTFNALAGYALTRPFPGRRAGGPGIPGGPVRCRGPARRGG